MPNHTNIWGPNTATIKKMENTQPRKNDKLGNWRSLFWVVTTFWVHIVVFFSLVQTRRSHLRVSLFRSPKTFWIKTAKMAGFLCFKKPYLSHPLLRLQTWQISRDRLACHSLSAAIFSQGQSWITYPNQVRSLTGINLDHRLPLAQNRHFMRGPCVSTSCQ